jgi:hypothetical protein
VEALDPPRQLDDKIMADKMTQKQKLLFLFKQNNNRLTLGMLLQYNVGYKAVTRFSDLRKDGYKIDLVHQDHEHPTNNVYELLAMPDPQDPKQMMLV